MDNKSQLKSVKSTIRFRFCPECAGKLVQEEISERLRLRCQKCGEIHYQNPFPATALICFNDRGELLLTRRSEPPCVGQWCLPGGFIEMGETAQEAALREFKEETGLEGKLVRVIDVASKVDGYWGDVVVIGFEVEVVGGKLTAGDDASEVGYFPLDDMPEIVFDTHRVILDIARTGKTEKI
ncbi:NUDIX hydrolase [candidate division LCP-89 bacterium B3_LCP]|uniref:NUDIX hydrolase n=1 Tax=candidate division LCP-89 bacterium B3_LCP TaxID=2012998 RepID=A0A532V0K4_UNCL8|nr:MAG: NUDIX hydrolase [candidate division LCP-89 bacterium B3_LCP]